MLLNALRFQKQIIRRFYTNVRYDSYMLCQYFCFVFFFLLIIMNKRKPKQLEIKKGCFNVNTEQQ